MIQHYLPQHLLSNLLGKLATSRIKWLKNLFIKVFLLLYKKIDLTETLEPNPFNYPSFNDFFTRALQPNARPLSGDATTIICPADGSIAQLGAITASGLITAKNHDFTISQLLGNPSLAETFQKGQFVTVYLAPYNYHRVHMPCQGTLQHIAYIPGKLFSVNKKTTQQIPDVYARNERLVTLFETTFGPIAIILVGALIVGSIETPWTGTITAKHPPSCPDNFILQRGAELGRFKLGSTVIMLFPPNTIQLAALHLEQPIAMGQAIGRTR